MGLWLKWGALFSVSLSTSHTPQGVWARGYWLLRVGGLGCLSQATRSCGSWDGYFPLGQNGGLRSCTHISGMVSIVRGFGSHLRDLVSREAQGQLMTQLITRARKGDRVVLAPVNKDGLWGMGGLRASSQCSSIQCTCIPCLGQDPRFQFGPILGTPQAGGPRSCPDHFFPSCIANMEPRQLVHGVMVAGSLRVSDINMHFSLTWGVGNPKASALAIGRGSWGRYPLLSSTAPARPTHPFYVPPIPTYSLLISW